MSQESVHQIDLVMFYFRELSPQNTFISICSIRISTLMEFQEKRKGTKSDILSIS